MGKENRIYIIKLALILFTITFIATLLLTLCNYLTKDKIAEINLENAEKAKQEVIADASFTEINLDDEFIKRLNSQYGFKSAFTAEKDGKHIGYCINLAPQGFGGPIDMIVGLDLDMNFTGIKIISMTETPGLGAKAQEKAFYGQFADGKTGQLSVVKNLPSPSESEIQAITGATISSQAVTDGANNAVKIVKLIQKEAE